MNSYEKGGELYTDGVLSDITERKRLEEALAYQATHDSLTGLSNRRVFEERCQQSLDSASLKGETCTLLYLDLDRFKVINDTLGHCVGDNLLQCVAQRLIGCLRESEMLMRSGSDEFFLILNGLHDEQVAAGVAKRMLGALNSPFQVMGTEVLLTASIGIALFPYHGRDLVSLERSADTAMYAAKRQGKNRFQIYSAAMKVAATRHLALEGELRRAMERGELALAYQPQFDLASNRISGVEALLRWNNRKFGPIPAGEFIPIAEETGLILPIADWVLLEACRVGRAWRDKGCSPVRLGINISAVQFVRGDLPAVVMRVLAETQFDPSDLVLEERCNAGHQ
jgi:diguanylate cyclase (GGDEF)-like protein